jgi:hypothetical protein
MDHEHFDALTRSLGGGAGTRRALLGLLAGGALGAFGRFSLAAVVEAKPHRKGKNRGKDKGKDKGKGKGPKGDCPATKKWCPGHGCVVKELCCPGQRLCGDGKCIGQGRCCPDERKCRHGCIPSDSCCGDERPCDGGGCAPLNGCCPNEKDCEGMCIPKTECCEAEPGPGPLCDHCHEPGCANGKQVCQPKPPPPCSWAETFNCATGKCECKGSCGDSNCCPIGEFGWHCHQGRCCIPYGEGRYCLPLPL